MEKCFTCKHWGGDKEKQRKAVEEFGKKCLDLKNGWPLYGDCKERREWLELSVNGDAYVFVEVAAGFGCVLYEQD
jgi:hypothetical protein